MKVRSFDLSISGGLLAMEKKIPVTIDGRELQALPGQTILDVAKENGIISPPCVITP